MKDLPKIAAVVLICVIMALLFRGGCRKSGSRTEASTVEAKSDTLRIRDTIYINTPTPADARQIGSMTSTLPIYRPLQFDSNPDGQETPASEQQLSDQEVQIQPRDSAIVEIPIEQRHYLGDDYEAWVSGYQPALDSLRVFPETKLIATTTEATKWKTKRWGLSIGAGLVATPTKVGPGIFIGATYTFIAF